MVLSYDKQKGRSRLSGKELPQEGAKEESFWFVFFSFLNGKDTESL